MSDETNRALTPGSRWRHYQGWTYRIIEVGFDEPTLDEVVIYQNETDGRVWVRRRDTFLSDVDGSPCFVRLAEDENVAKVPTLEQLLARATHEWRVACAEPNAPGTDAVVNALPYLIDAIEMLNARVRELEGKP